MSRRGLDGLTVVRVLEEHGIPYKRTPEAFELEALRAGFYLRSASGISTIHSWLLVDGKSGVAPWPAAERVFELRALLDHVQCRTCKATGYIKSDYTGRSKDLFRGTEVMERRCSRCKGHGYVP